MSKVNELEQVRSDTVSQDQIDVGVQVRCSNSAQGCEWIGSQAKLDDHLKSEGGCLWADVECPNRCISGYDDNGKELFVTVKRKSLKEHLEEECLHRIYECECGMKDEYSKIVNEHQLKECREWYIPCENGCNSKIKRKEIDAHQRVCPELVVECPYARIGCDKGGIRQCELIAHLHSDRVKHDLYSRRDDEHKRELKAQIDCLNAQVGRLKIESDQTKTQLKDSEQKFVKLELMKTESKSKFRAISTDISILKSSQCSLRSELALNSVQTQLETNLALCCGDEPLVLRMTAYSEYQRRGKVWKSQQFNVGFQSQVYKMFISVFPRGIKSGAGSHISLRLHICCVGSENHHLIPWPNLEGFISVNLMSKAGNPMGIFDAFHNFNRPLQHLPQQNEPVILCTIEKFATVEAVQESVVEDSIALVIQHSDFVIIEMPTVANNNC